MSENLSTNDYSPMKWRVASRWPYRFLLACILGLLTAAGCYAAMRFGYDIYDVDVAKQDLAERTRGPLYLALATGLISGILVAAVGAVGLFIAWPATQFGAHDERGSHAAP